MVTLSPRQTKILLLSAAVAVLLLIIFIVYSIFAALAGLITSAGSALAFCLCFWLLGRTAVRFFVFPGSFWVWRRNVELNYCRDMAAQFSQRIRDLRIALEILLDSSNERDKSDFLPRSFEASEQAKMMLLVIGDTFNQQKTEGTLKPRQQALLDLVSELIQALADTRLILSNSDELSLWDWLDLESDESDWLNVVFEDFPNNTSANTALAICSDIEAMLFESFGPTTLFKRVKRWLTDNTLGSLDQMRIELKSRYNAEQIQIPTDDNKVIDCFLFTALGNTPQSSTVMICNPNAGFYEFAYYQSEWLQFYLGNGLNVFMWNYRGYGLSTGHPSPKRLQQDAVIIANYLKREKGVEKLGVHGESLGGCIATHVAQVCPVDFLFADRSLTSLADVAKYNFGCIAEVLLYVFAPDWRFNSAEKFLGSTCFKLISSDPKDAVISDLASVKTGVAIRTIDPSGKLNLAKHVHILTEKDFNEFFQSFTELMRICSSFNKADFERSPRGLKIVNLQTLQETSQNTSSYMLLSKETDSMDDEVFNALIYYMCNALEGIDAGGKSLLSVYHTKNQRVYLTAWLIVLEVWGSCSALLPQDISKNWASTVERMRVMIEELQRLYSDHEFLTTPAVEKVCRNLKVILIGFNKILIYLESKLSESARANYFKAGILIPLECGHSGPYSASERAIFETLLAQQGFIVN
mmetsp:Transcript_11462/g.22508  ORF Transcript_11462/g.22508 Transcript_11462/m.22508 type:complete len:695 (+) Transcript_11462:675-2759(+)